MISSRLVFLFLVSAFVADATLMQKRRASLRHGAHAGRHIQKSMLLKHFGTASLVQENKKNATALLAQTKGAGWDKDDDEDDKKASKSAPSTPPLIGKLKNMLGELKERRENVVHLETTLKQLESTLQESKRMHSVASTEKAQATYLKQVKETQKIYRDTFALYEQSREEATDAARKLTSEMNAAKEVEEEVLGEAKTQLKHYENFPVHNALDDEDDDTPASKHSKGSFLAKKQDDSEDDDDDDDKDADSDDQSDSDKDE